jgi:LPXTG-motif cell wall-anchored protein
MRRLLILIALTAGLVLPAAGAIGSSPAQAGHTGVGIRLVDAPVATREDPRARVYIIDHVKPGTTIERRIEVSNDTGKTTAIAVYPAAAAIKGGSFVGLEGETPNELSTWTTVSTPRLRLADGVDQMVGVTIDVPADASPGEQYAVVWAQTSSGAGGGGITQVSRVGIRVYLSVGPGGAPASAFNIASFTAERDASGSPVVEATVRNTGGRALDLTGTLMLADGPAGLTAGPFPVSLGTTLAIGDVEPVTIELDKQLPAGPWEAHLVLTSGLLTEKAHATLTFPTSGIGPTITVANGHGPLWWVVAGLLALALLVLAWWLLRRRRRDRSGAEAEVVPQAPMSRRHHLVPLAMLAALVASLAAAPPAAADQTAISLATITLEAGGLSITAPSDAGNLGTRSNQVGAITVSGQLGQVQVTDSRDAPAGSGWTATAISTAFTPLVGPAIGAASVGYTAGTITKVGTATYTANDPVNLTGVSPVVTATAITGDNTATWNPTIHVAVGANMAAGVYSATITHSLS